MQGKRRRDTGRHRCSLAHATFRYSIAYLVLLFAALLADHYL